MEQQEVNFEQEEKAMRALLDKGVEITIDRRGLITLLTGKPRTHKFTIKQPYLGTLYEITHLFLQSSYREEEFIKDPIAVSRRLAHDDSFLMCKVVATAIINHKLGIKLFSGIFARYLFNRIKPDKLLQIILIIVGLNNTVDFTHSIRLIQAQRKSAPKNLSPTEHGG